MKVERVASFSEWGKPGSSPVLDPLFASVGSCPAGSRADREGQRLLWLSSSRVTLHTAPPEDAPKAAPAVKSRTWKLAPFAKGGDILNVALAADANKAWALLSDSFMRAVGRYVASVTLDGKVAKWSSLKQPLKWSPYSHGGMTVDAIGAATAKSVFVYASSHSEASLGPLGGRAARVAPGRATFDATSVMVFLPKKKRMVFYDAAGQECDGFSLVPRLLGPLKTIGSVAAIGLRGRDVWLYGYRAIARLRLDVDPPRLVMPTAPKRGSSAATPTLPKGSYGAVEDGVNFLRGGSAPPLALELVRAWDLNETPVFSKPSRFGALALSGDVVTFYKRKDDKLRASFDFLARAVEVTLVDAPASARTKTPDRVVLAELRTPSGLTQVLCREEFGKRLRDHCNAFRTKRKKR
ncbi:MAG: hypothetical protein IPG50_33630 [Myxococcales bacterium]|nr:hypothetical protein [Myxococcales bacterium]